VRTAPHLSDHARQQTSPERGTASGYTRTIQRQKALVPLRHGSQESCSLETSPLPHVTRNKRPSQYAIEKSPKLRHHRHANFAVVRFSALLSLPASAVAMLRGTGLRQSIVGHSDGNVLLRLASKPQSETAQDMSGVLSKGVGLDKLREALNVASNVTCKPNGVCLVALMSCPPRDCRIVTDQVTG
jgi:hypothetical protein